jgi:cytochrome b6-f complex iron-sulfur subunit
MNNDGSGTKGPSRRRVLFGAWIVASVALIGQAGIALANFLKPVTKPGGFGGLVIAGKPSEFKPGTVTAVREGHFYISHLQDGGYLAMWWRCTHLGCTVPWRATEKQFHCPCHGSLFNPKGEVTGGPAPRPLDLFPMKLVDGNLVVDTGQPIQRAAYDPSQEFTM